jgi:hypothetical protein
VGPADAEGQRLGHRVAVDRVERCLPQLGVVAERSLVLAERGGHVDAAEVRVGPVDQVRVAPHDRHVLGVHLGDQVERARAHLGDGDRRVGNEPVDVAVDVGQRLAVRTLLPVPVPALEHHAVVLLVLDELHGAGAREG